MPALITFIKSTAVKEIKLINDGQSVCCTLKTWQKCNYTMSQPKYNITCINKANCWAFQAHTYLQINSNVPQNLICQIWLNMQQKKGISRVISMASSTKEWFQISSTAVPRQPLILSFENRSIWFYVSAVFNLSTQGK